MCFYSNMVYTNIIAQFKLFPINPILKYLSYTNFREKYADLIFALYR